MTSTTETSFIPLSQVILALAGQWTRRNVASSGDCLLLKTSGLRKMTSPVSSKAHTSIALALKGPQRILI